MAQVEVRLGDASYAIHIDRGNLGRLGGLMAALGYAKRTAVVTHPMLRELFGAIVEQSLVGAGFDPIFVELPEGEATKSFEWMTKVYDPLFEHQLDRKSALVALGGGVIGDLTGFIAATYMRGIPFVQVPTTVLAQVDASVGGKTAVNHPRGKNLIGAFHQPDLVLMDVATLDTLPMRDFRAGLVEIIKHGVIMDEPLFVQIESSVDSILQRRPETLIEIIAQSCRDKARIVEQDERESGIRALLNYGHTFGHALENLTDYGTYRHGEAVAAGMICASQLAINRELMAPEAKERQQKLLERFELPTRFPELDEEDLLQAMFLDKKTEHGKLRFVVAECIGKAMVLEGVSAEEALKAIREA